MTESQEQAVTDLENFRPDDGSPARLAELLYLIAGMELLPPSTDLAQLETDAGFLLATAVEIEAASIISRPVWGALREAMRYYQAKYLGMLVAAAAKTPRPEDL